MDLSFPSLVSSLLGIAGRHGTQGGGIGSSTSGEQSMYSRHKKLGGIIFMPRCFSGRGLTLYSGGKRLHRT